MTPNAAERAAASLADIVRDDLRILLVAINPAPLSATTGAHFATPRNPFWDLLHASGLTSRRYLPTEARALLDDGIGLTSLVARPTRAAADLSMAERRAGAETLRRTVTERKPAVVALLGLTLFPILCPNAHEPGPGAKAATFAGARLFVLPNPSGRNLAYPGFAAKLVWYRMLAETFPR